MPKGCVIYTNDNGTDSYLLGDGETPEDKYKELLGEENAFLYFDTHCTFVLLEDNGIVDCWEVFIPEYKDR